MTKKEKILAICLSISILFLITSSITTIIMNKPQGYKFNIERWINK